MHNITIQRIATILEDMFGADKSQVMPEDTLDEDWAIRGDQLDVFEREFCAEFGLTQVPHNVKTIEDYARLVS